MDERLLLGVGNGYADEILWRARLHPRRLATGLRETEWETLLAALRDVLYEAVAQGGEPDFLDADCRRGRCERRIHHHAGDPCPRCGAALAGYERSGRETNFCPVCQPEASRWRSLAGRARLRALFVEAEGPETAAGGVTLAGTGGGSFP